jgi:hypothetical protein
VSGLLLAKVDEITARMGELIDAVWTVNRAARAGAGPVVPQRHHHVFVMVDETHLRAHARPLDEPEP